MTHTPEEIARIGTLKEIQLKIVRHRAQGLRPGDIAVELGGGQWTPATVQDEISVINEKLGLSAVQPQDRRKAANELYELYMQRRQGAPASVATPTDASASATAQASVTVGDQASGRSEEAADTAADDAQADESAETTQAVTEVFFASLIERLKQLPREHKEVARWLAEDRDSSTIDLSASALSGRKSRLFEALEFEKSNITRAVFARLVASAFRYVIQGSDVPIVVLAMQHQVKRTARMGDEFVREVMRVGSLMCEMNEKQLQLLRVLLDDGDFETHMKLHKAAALQRLNKIHHALDHKHTTHGLVVRNHITKTALVILEVLRTRKAAAATTITPALEPPPDAVMQQHDGGGDADRPDGEAGGALVPALLPPVPERPLLPAVPEQPLPPAVPAVTHEASPVPTGQGIAVTLDNPSTIIDVSVVSCSGPANGMASQVERLRDRGYHPEVVVIHTTSNPNVTLSHAVLVKRDGQ